MSPGMQTHSTLLLYKGTNTQEVNKPTHPYIILTLRTELGIKQQGALQRVTRKQRGRRSFKFPPNPSVTSMDRSKPAFVFFKLSTLTCCFKNVLLGNRLLYAERSVSNL